MTGVTNTELALAIQQVIARVDAREDELKAWQSGPFDGGPFGDGRYQITNLLGEVSYFKSPARLAYEIGLLTTAGTGALAAAEAARDGAEDALAEATQKANAAAGSATTATTKAAEADNFRQLAANSEANALVHRNAAEGSASSASTNRAIAVSARDAAQLAQAGAQTARADAEVFRNEAQTARDQAQSFAASINPATLATKAELQAELNALIGAAPGTLNTLNELAAALGNDPNFAATIAAQIAGKANTVHTHTIAQVTGLQTALDGKASLSHTHVIADVTGLQTALNAKLDSSAFTWANLAGKPSTFTPSAHSHVIADVTGLQAALDARLERGTNFWINSTDGVNRFFFAASGRSYYKSGDGHEWRGSGDANIMELSNSGSLFVRGNHMELVGGSPTLWIRDTNHRTFGIHVNDDLAYFMRGGTNDTVWSQINGRWPMVLSLNTGDLTLAGNFEATDVRARAGVVIGDDAVVGDVNIGNTVCIRGQQNSDRGYIQFGIPGSNSLLGAVAGGALTYNGNTVWHAGNFDPASRLALSDFTGSNQSLSSNGYQRLPGGLILQWGSVFISGNGSVTVTYPISFPNAAFIVLADGGETVTNRQDNGPAVTSFNQFNASITNGIDVGISTRWFAIGW